MLKVLVVDDDQGLRLSIKTALSASRTYLVDEAFDGINALEKYEASEPKYDIAILDVDMPRLNGLETLKRLKEKNPGLIVVMLTAHAMVQDAVQAVKDGAYNYLSKPVSGDELLSLLDKAVEAHRLISSIAASSPVLLEEGRKIIGSNTQMQKVFNIIHKLAKVDTPVLIRGASGTGKELVARAIHFNSARKDGKFVAINCSAIPENLFESELFGHEKGAFTGADQRKIGKFQYAEGGTLFLDEVGDMPALMQVKILRVLQERVFTPVGSNREFPTNVRIIAATNRPLEDMIQKGNFREDLFYRLNVVPIFLPSLSDRKDDIDRMVQNFIKKFNEIHRKSIRGISPDALNILKRHNWPGNIRELENVIEHAFVLETSNVISPASLPESLLEAVGVDLLDVSTLAEATPASPSSASSGSIQFAGGDDELDSDIALDEEEAEDVGLALTGVNENFDFNAQKEAFEKEFIMKALKAFKGRINQTALHANIPKKTLLRKIEKYGINAKDFQ
ncbi:MAG: sigma-54-dependent transcriptional regulator [Bdellovibrionales bacterium]